MSWEKNISIVKPTQMARILSALLLGVLFGYYIHYDYLRWNQRGREAFLLYQGHRFDQSMAVVRPTALTVISITIVMVIAFAIYELVAAILSKIIGSGDTSTSSPGGMG